MNKLIPIPYVIVTLADPIEAARVQNRVSDKFYTQRSELSASLKLAGGWVVKNNRELRKAVEELESVIRNHTTLPFSMLDFGTMYLKPCVARDDDGEMSDMFFFPADATVGEEVEVFHKPGKCPRYYGTGKIVGENTVTVTYKKDV